MKGHQEVLACFNHYLRIELTGHKQYLINSRLCADQGLAKIAKIQHDYSEEETLHAGKIIDRILFLEGVPELADYREVKVHQSVEEQLKQDQTLISHAIDVLRGAVAVCAKHGDEVSRDFFVAMIEDEEHHIHWVNTQLKLIKELGLENYHQSQL